jgi:hypothetical protein
MSGLGAALYAAEGSHAKVKKSLDDKPELFCAAKNQLASVHRLPHRRRSGAEGAPAVRFGDYSGALTLTARPRRYSTRNRRRGKFDPLFVKSAVLSEIAAAQSLLFAGFAGDEKTRRDKLLALYGKLSRRAKKVASLKSVKSK